MSSCGKNENPQEMNRRKFLKVFGGGAVASSAALYGCAPKNEPGAAAAENGGADSVSLINTLLGMAIDAERRRPILSTVTGGMSGAAVKPIALRMVWQVAKAVKIPVIGLGGIMNWKDAVEFMLAGASAIQIGTANFIDPAVTVKVVEGINDYLNRHGYQSVKDIIGALEV